MNKNIVLEIGVIALTVILVTAPTFVETAFSGDNSICKNGDCVNKNIIKNECSSAKDSFCANAAAIEVRNNLSP